MPGCERPLSFLSDAVLRDRFGLPVLTAQMAAALWFSKSAILAPA